MIGHGKKSTKSTSQNSYKARRKGSMVNHFACIQWSQKPPQGTGKGFTVQPFALFLALRGCNITFLPALLLDIFSSDLFPYREQ